jgi:hypothetical protein
MTRDMVDVADLAARVVALESVLAAMDAKGLHVSLDVDRVLDLADMERRVAALEAYRRGADLAGVAQARAIEAHDEALRRLVGQVIGHVVYSGRGKPMPWPEDAAAGDAGAQPDAGPVCQCAVCEQERRILAHFEAGLAPHTGASNASNPGVGVKQSPDAGPVADAVGNACYWLRWVAAESADAETALERAAGAPLVAAADALAAHDADVCTSDARYRADLDDARAAARVQHRARVAAGLDVALHTERALSRRAADRGERGVCGGEWLRGDRDADFLLGRAGAAECAGGHKRSGVSDRGGVPG